MLTKEDIIGRKPRTETVEVPEWGGEVMLRAVTVEERGQLEQWVQRQRGDISRVRARLLRMCLCNGDGSLMFSEQEESQLGSLDGGVSERLVERCLVLCGMKSSEVSGEKA